MNERKDHAATKAILTWREESIRIPGTGKFSPGYPTEGDHTYTMLDPKYRLTSQGKVEKCRES